MQTENPIFDDLSKLASGAVGTLDAMRKEIEGSIKAKVERIASEMDLVPREDFEVVRDMAKKARAENDELRARIETLEAALGTKKAPAKSKSGKK